MFSLIPSLQAQQGDYDYGPKIQWEMSFVDDEEKETVKEQDWILESIVAENGINLGVGYSSSATHSVIRVATWIAAYPDGTPITQMDANFGNSAKNGTFEDVIEGPDGYYMVGKKDVGSTTKIALMKLDKTSLNVTLEKLISAEDIGLAAGAKVTAAGLTVAGNDLFIVGKYTNGAQIDGLILKTDLSGNVIDHFLVDAYVGMEDRLSKCAVLPGSGGSYEIVFTGWAVKTDNSFTTPVGNTIYKDAFGVLIPDEEKIVVRDSDILYGKIDQNLSSLTLQMFNSATLYFLYPKNPQLGDEFGPFSPGDFPCFNCVAKDYFTNNSQDRGYSIDVLPDGSIGITAMLNTLVMTESVNSYLYSVDLFESSENVVTAPSPTHDYHDYIDGDFYFIRLNPGGNNILNGTQHLGRVSGADSHADFDITTDGSIIAGFTTACNSFDDDLLPVEQDESNQNNILVKLNSSYELEWRRHFPGPGESEGMCLFDVKVTRDGGYLVSGNNEGHIFVDGVRVEVEKYSMIKLGPDCQVNPDEYGPNDIVAENHIVDGFEMWTTDRKVKGTITIKEDGYLYINGSAQNINIEFANQKYNKDIKELINDPNNGGILIEDGGRLVVKNATLKGMDVCGLEQMWEGVRATASWFGGPQDFYSTRVDLLPGAVIQDGIIGLLLGYAEYVDATENGSIPLISGTGKWELSGATYDDDSNFNGGAVLKTNEATFLNNYESVIFTPFYYPNSSSLLETNFSCTDEMIDPAFFNTSQNKIEGSRAFAVLRSVQSVDFENCVMTGNQMLPIAMRGTGIESFDSRFNVKGISDPNISNFKNLSIGVDALALTGGLLNSPFIKGNTFENIPHNINLRQTYSSVVSDNYFKDISYGKSGWGIFATDPHGLFVQHNTFASNFSNQAIYGTIIRNSAADGGDHYGNIYDGLPYGTQFEQDNSEIDARCSEYENSSQHAWVVAPDVAGAAMNNVGTGPFIGQQKADNSFKDPCAGTSPDYKHIFSNIAFDYYEKAGNLFPADDNVQDLNCVGPEDVVNYNIDDESFIDCQVVEPPCPEPPCFGNFTDAYNNSPGGVNDRNPLLSAYTHWDVHEVPDSTSLIELDSAMNFLANRQQKEDIRILTATLTGLGNYSEANTWLAQVNGTDPQTLAFIDYYTVLIDEGLAGRSVYELSDSLTQTLIPVLAVASLGVEGNQQNLDYLYNKTYHELEPEEIQAEERNDNAPSVDEHFTSLTFAKPNPFQETVTFYTTEAYEAGIKLEVRDVNGKLVWNGTIDAGAMAINWSPVGLVTGTYICLMKLPDGSMHYEKLVFIP